MFIYTRLLTLCFLLQNTIGRQGLLGCIFSWAQAQPPCLKAVIALSVQWKNIQWETEIAAWFILNSFQSPNEHGGQEDVFLSGRNTSILDFIFLLVGIKKNKQLPSVFPEIFALRWSVNSSSNWWDISSNEGQLLALLIYGRTCLRELCLFY